MSIVTSRKKKGRKRGVKAQSKSGPAGESKKCEKRWKSDDFGDFFNDFAQLGKSVCSESMS